VTEDMPTVRAPSIRDVARLAGVSHQTVSRVLNKHPSIRESTRARVLQVMEDLQYRPNRAARALSRGRSRTIGILSAQSLDYGPASSIAAIQDAARSSGYYVQTVNLTASDRDSIQVAIRQLMLQAVEGIVVIAPQVRVFDVLEELAISVPFVSLQSTENSVQHATSLDQVEGARMAARHLIHLGHRRIHHLAGPQDWIEAEARMHGFLLEMGDMDIPVTAPILGDWTADFGYHAGRELFGRHDFTAVFSSNDQMALGLMHAARDAGLDLPRDVSIVGFDDIPEAAHFWPPLTTVRQDFGALGRRSISLLLSRLPGNEPMTVTEPIVPRLIVRGSTARPSR
jgi:DNA-binding LacI/PurR family transcriptional regulator